MIDRVKYAANALYMQCQGVLVQRVQFSIVVVRKCVLRTTPIPETQAEELLRVALLGFFILGQAVVEECVIQLL